MPMSFIEGMVVPVPRHRRDAYLAFIKEIFAIRKDYGALAMTVSWSDHPPEGKVTSFPTAVQATADEAVSFAWIVWPSREAREEGLKKVRADARMKAIHENPPHDGRRMLIAGFETIYQTEGER